MGSTAPARAAGTAKVMTARALEPSRPALYLVLLCAAALRLGIFIYTSTPQVLEDRPELSTPFSSLRALRETHYLFHRPPSPSPGTASGGIPDPYSAGTVHHSPLLLPLLNSALQRMQRSDDVLPTALIWTAADVVAGWLLFRICLTREVALWARKTHLWSWDQSRAVKVAALFLFNPYTLATCLARSTVALEVVALLATIHAAMAGSAVSLALHWAFSSLISLYPALLLPMLIQLARRRAGERVYEREVARIGSAASSTAKSSRQLGFLVDRVRSAKRFMVFKCVVLMPAALAGGLWLSRAIALSPGDASIRALVSNIAAVMQVPLEEGWAWTEQVYGSVLLATDLTPNLGLWWYFFMEIFDHFRDFFLLTFNVHLACYVLPFSIKYRQDPLFGITLMSGVIAVFKSYPTLGDHAVFLALLSLHSQILEYMRYPLVSTLTYTYCTCLSPAFHHLWLTAGSANANFFYAITLVWALGGGMLVLDAMWAWGRERWEKERPPIRARPKVQPKSPRLDEPSLDNDASDGGAPVAVKDQKENRARRVVVQV
ncbi:GPI transamidase component PIG-U [Moesziomyces antarcticus]|uniref:Related to GPI - transamidase subunit n=1 Tax=Pseudozyma antarctica TaxID=84753 RepID=A0A5C3FFN6_PSEA2|nr:GPI transamidase component PIG-U [Moesziomyces antarcticus]GAK61992.1 GPI transamidase component PIG-U [Moesziomyces antarcticus]SPO42517.1 related to GPI - transamidase subunit [Moesziomyces antarcticus]